MENDRISDFFIVAFIFSWVLWIPIAMVSAGFSFPQPLQAFLESPYNPAAFGPTLAAVLLSYRYGGRDELLALLRKGVNYDFHRLWWPVILLFFPVLTAVALYLGVLWGDPHPYLYWTSQPLTVIMVFIYIFFLGGHCRRNSGGGAMPFHGFRGGTRQSTRP